VPAIEDEEPPPMEPSYLYSNRSFWYPQSPFSDYATRRSRGSAVDTGACERDLVSTSTKSEHLESAGD